MKEGVSIIVCSYNGAARLPKTLAHLAAQKYASSISVELIFVDNASTDGSAEVVKKIWDENGNPYPLNLISESIAGLAFAREAGIKNAGYSYLLFCDDDNWLREDYVNEAFYMMHTNSDIGVLGGCSKGAYEAEPPGWFYDHTENFAIGVEQNDKTLWATESVWGAGCVVRKEAVDFLVEKNFVHLNSGRKGKSLIGGEDTELCLALKLAGYSVYRTQKLFFTHFIPESRLTYSYLRKLYRSIGASNVTLDMYRKKGVSKQWLPEIKNSLRMMIGYRDAWLKYINQSNYNYRVLLLEMEIGKLTKLFALGREFSLLQNKIRYAKWNRQGFISKKLAC